MLRFAVTIQLVLSLAVGPWLCCCAVARLVGEPQTSESTPHKLCPNCPNKPAPARDDAPCKCPCQEHSAMANPTLDAGAVDSLASIEPVVVPPAPTPVRGVTRPELAFPPPRLPSLSTADILFAHHNLRC